MTLVRFEGRMIARWFEKLNWSDKWIAGFDVILDGQFVGSCQIRHTRRLDRRLVELGLDPAQLAERELPKDRDVAPGSHRLTVEGLRGVLLQQEFEVEPGKPLEVRVFAGRIRPIPRRGRIRIQPLEVTTSRNGP
jgi:hypothetical protein